MISRQVFDRIGLLNTIYGAGSGEDIEFCIEAERAGYEICQVGEKTLEKGSAFYVGSVPLYHKGEGTVHDVSLVPNWNNIFYQNSLIIAEKYNPEFYKQMINHAR
jgi:hypothetical protein